MPVSLEISGHIALVVIDYPPANALSKHCALQLEERLDEAFCNEGVRALVITGAGGKFFAAGADVGELASFDSAAGMEAALQVRDLFQRLRTSRLPVVAAINGVAAGGGLELALGCDFRLAAESALMGLPEIKLGVLPAAGGTQLLPRVVGAAPALELMLTGDLISADEAFEIGLVNRVHKAEALMDEALQLGGRLADMAPLAVAEIKEAVLDAMSLPLVQGLSRETERFGRLCASADKNEGAAAFMERRAPCFTGE